MRNFLAKRETLAALLVITLAAALAYLPLVNGLGYVHDDWFPSAARVGGVSLFDMHTVDRPVMGVVYQAADAVLGENPLGWHLYAFGLRLLGAGLVFWLLRMLWPAQRRATLLMALLFLVYPGFLLQPNANNYSNHLLGLALGILSLGLTVYIRKSRRPGLNTALTLVSAGLILVYPNIYEALIGLEGARLVLLWLLEARTNPRPLPAVLKRWVPYLAALAAFGAWRFLIFKSARMATDASALLGKYRSEPLAMAAQIVVENLKDILETAVLAWSVPFHQVLATAGYASLAAGCLLGLSAAMLFGLYWKALPPETEPADHPGWTREALLAGAAMVFFALLPVTFADRDVRFEYNLNRYTLQAALGAVVLLGGALFSLKKPAARFALAAVLLGSAVTTQYLNASSYREFWRQERQLWWQLAWRAPDLKNETALLPVLPEGYRLAEGYEIWAPANLIYRPGRVGVTVSGEPLNETTLLRLARQEEYGRTMRRIVYTVEMKNSLVVSIPPEGACLHVHDGANLELSADEDPLVRLAAPYSRVGMIEPAAAPHLPPQEIFGAEPEHGWCYYYQKAGLARQQGDWDAVLALYDEASGLGLKPADPVEWLPFYQAFAYRRFDRVNEIAEPMRADEDFLRSYCAPYGLIEAGGDPEETLAEFMVKNLCAQ